MSKSLEEELREARELEAKLVCPRCIRQTCNVIEAPVGRLAVGVAYCVNCELVFQIRRFEQVPATQQTSEAEPSEPELFQDDWDFLQAAIELREIKEWNSVDAIAKKWNPKILQRQRKRAERLAALGYLESKPKRGYRVTPLGEKAFAENAEKQG